ncbi:hypothetical protein [Humidisolicoccus flavus]|uniref:hypothetical protein n=1 Tax=Humidisolicoccus flavus TaxID=3111414 RepID=UPI0032461216
MYGALWRVIPGPVWFKLVVVLALVAAVAAVLILYVYPWVQLTFFPTPEVTVS